MIKSGVNKKRKTKNGMRKEIKSGIKKKDKNGGRGR